MPLATLRFILAHPLNRGRPGATLLNYVGWQFGARLAPGPVRRPFVDDFALLVSPGMTGATGNIYCGLHEFEEMAFCLHLLRPGDLFVDVGANVGSYTVLALAAGADAIAFEPGERYADLVRNVAANRARADCRNCAVGAEVGALAFTRGRDTVNRAALAGEAAVSVPMTTLDAALERAPTLVKMDVEGFEPAVVAGGQRTLPQALAIIFETGQEGRYGFGAADIARQLADWGFREFHYDPLARAECAEPAARANAIYVRGDVAERLRTAPQRRIHGRLL